MLHLTFFNNFHIAHYQANGKPIYKNKTSNLSAIILKQLRKSFEKRQKHQPVATYLKKVIKPVSRWTTHMVFNNNLKYVKNNTNTDENKRKQNWKKIVWILPFLRL